jgi:RimJ/RimL family protein N-acetyltransferase
MIKKPVLSGTQIDLRPVTVEDATAMFASLSDKESMRLTGTQESFTFDRVRQFCEKIEHAEDRADYAITLKDDPAYIGEAVLNDIDWRNRTASFRIALGNEALLGKGYGSEATQLIIDYGFQMLNLHRIELEVYDFNPRARHVYEKIGFVFEGIRRDVLLWEGEYHSAIVMGILAPEYKERENR